MRKIIFRIVLHIVPTLMGFIAMAHVYAIQPWDDGVKPLLNRMSVIDQALSLNMLESMSESLTVSDFIRLAAERDSLLLEMANLVNMFVISTEVRDSSLVNYAIPPDGRFNSALHTDAQARQ